MQTGPESSKPRIVSVGTANPSTTYTQDQLLALFEVDDPQIRRFYEHSHIHKRHLVLPSKDETGCMPKEDGATLLKKHRDTSIDVGGQAIDRCLESAGIEPEQIDTLITVSSTGFLCPGLSAHLVASMGFRPDIGRADLVGMGCSGGMNGLQAAAHAAQAHPGSRVLLLCCEICSAAYVFDMEMNTAVVNSLFGDGAAAVLIQVDENGEGPQLIDFSSHLISEGIEEMRFDFADGLFSFFLGRDVPYLIGEQADRPVQALLSRFGLKKRDIRHWLIHSGGKKVIDSIKYNLALTEHDVRHTRSILRDFGNLSSASFLFSYQELTREKIARRGEWGMTMAMGPGLSIEAGLLRW